MRRQCNMRDGDGAGAADASRERRARESAGGGESVTGNSLNRDATRRGVLVAVLLGAARLRARS